MTDIFTSNQMRYRELIYSAQVNEGLWIAESTELALILSNESGEGLILVWPTADAARKVIDTHADLAYFKPVFRSLERWLSKSTPHLIEDGILVATYPDENYNCLRVPARSFAHDLSAQPRLQGTDISRLRGMLTKRKSHTSEA